MDSQRKSEFAEAMAAGAAKVSPVIVDNMPFVVVPQGYEVRALEHMLKAPTRLRGSVSMHDAQSFCEYVQTTKGLSTRIYLNLDVTSAKFVAVLNHGDDVDPQWRDHRASYVCSHTQEWNTWMSKNGVKTAQIGFAQFIEDNLPDIAAPEGARMLEVARGLEARKSVAFTSAVRLDNGDVEFLYQDETKAATKGKLDIPSEFVIRIPPFVNSDEAEITARLRYRIEDGKLVMWYDLLRPAKAIEEAVQREIERIQAATGITIWRGAI